MLTELERAAQLGVQPYEILWCKMVTESVKST